MRPKFGGGRLLMSYSNFTLSTTITHTIYKTHLIGLPAKWAWLGDYLILAVKSQSSLSIILIKIHTVQMNYIDMKTQCCMVR